LVAATSFGLAAVGFGAIDGVGSQTMLGIVALSAALVLLLGRRVPKAWGEGPAFTAGAIGAVAASPLLGAVASMLAAASVVSAEAWHRAGATVAADLQLADAGDHSSLALALQLAAVAVAVVALVRRGAWLAIGASAAVVAALALAISPLLLPL